MCSSFPMIEVGDPYFWNHWAYWRKIAGNVWKKLQGLLDENDMERI